MRNWLVFILIAVLVIGTDAPPAQASFDPQSHLLYTAVTIPSGNTIANTTTETPFASSYQFPANTIQNGQVIHLFGLGNYSAPFASAGTTTAKIRLSNGATIYNLVVTPALSNALGATNYGYSFDVLITFKNVGSSATAEAGGLVTFNTGLATSVALEIASSPTTVDTTQPLTLQATCTFNIASPSLSNTLRQLVITSLPPVAASN